MSPKHEEKIETETFDRLRAFMNLSPGDRDEKLFLQVQRHKSLLESEGITSDLKKFADLMNGTTEKAGLPVRVEWLEKQVGKVVKSNAQLQRALYIALGGFAAIKLLFAILPPVNH